MAIKLEVREYCSNCMDFVADVERPFRLHGDNEPIYQSDTIVRCKQRGKCEAIRRHLDTTLGKEE